MTNPAPATFDASWHHYAEAHARCQTLSGATLGSAQDQEREAILQLSNTRAVNLDDLGKKLDALRDLLEAHAGACLDQHVSELSEACKNARQAKATEKKNEGSEEMDNDESKDDESKD